MERRVKTVGIVSLSSGILGEESVRHELELGKMRLNALGLKVKFMPHALKGLEFVREHPEKRAEDLLAAFADDGVDMILCAIGGDDTFRLLPFLFENGELENAVKQKIFLGFSDTTINHFMLNKVGLKTFYGQSFLADVCEPGEDMLPYSRAFFEELIESGRIKEIKPSPVWYEERKSFGIDQLGKNLRSFPNGGFELLQGAPRFCGEILGGCIDSIYDIFNGERYAEMPVLCRKYRLFPSKEEWRGKILLLESSEEKMPPEKYRRALEYLKDEGVFGSVSGVLAGKPMDGAFEDEYKAMLKEVIGDERLPVLCNVSIGHAQPRCIIPFGVKAFVDAEKQIISFE